MFLRGPLGPYVPVWEQFRKDHRMMGLTSMGPYPLYHEAYGAVPPAALPTDGWNRPFVQSCEAWAHCFRRPELYLPPDRRWELLSGSDFCDFDRVWSIGAGDGMPAKRWDLVYSCLGNRFNEVQKNWDFAKACLRKLCVEGRLRVLLIGRVDSPDIPSLPGVEAYEFLPWSQFIQAVARARVAFFPNALDASPRVMTEAMALGLPALVNKRILGGWKYINDDTGMFFTDEDDVLDAALTLLSGSYRPREWFTAHHGLRRTQVRLAELMREVSAAGDGRTPAADVERARFVGTLG
jgi:glycosyltransferase involved in cell wall biosynthesis